ncbi:IS110 family RNA-guided transposase [Kineococcus sp. SYSU DK018]|uniref:IS110 family transposase n=1 Tax=Kineococcus sp. SYSU DK018 TaxID=3383139 RepID=UPI003D7DBC99
MAIGMDPHERSATIEVVDEAEHVLLSQRFVTGTDGYRAMLAAVGQWPARTWAVEGANGAGRHLAQRLVADGETVLDVPAKLSAQVRAFETGHGRKTDATDAHSIATVAARHRERREVTTGRRSAGLRVVTVDDETVALRLLADRRDELGVRKTEIVDRIHRLLGELIGGGAMRFLTAAHARELLDGLALAGPAALMGAQLAGELVEELAAIQAKIKAAERQLQQLVIDSGSHLPDLYGIGPSSAAWLLGDVGDIARFPTRDRFASWSGTAPIDASSGDNEHHRLSRAGNRRLNRVLHTMAIVQRRQPGTAGRVFFDRKRGEGKSSMEALRALKRRLSNVVYRQMVADADDRMNPAPPVPERGPAGSEAASTGAQVWPLPAEAAQDPWVIEAAMTGPGGQARAALDSSATDCDPGVGSSDEPLPGPASTSISTRSARRKRPARHREEPCEVVVGR